MITERALKAIRAAREAIEREKNAKAGETRPTVTRKNSDVTSGAGGYTETASKNPGKTSAGLEVAPRGKRAGKRASKGG